MISPFQSFVIFSLGWEVRGQITKRLCLKCSARRAVLAAAKYLIRKQTNWRLQLALTMIMCGPLIDTAKVFGIKTILRMVQNARAAQSKNV